MEGGKIHGKTRWCKVLLMLLVTIFESEGKELYTLKYKNDVQYCVGSANDVINRSEK